MQRTLRLAHARTQGLGAGGLLAAARGRRAGPGPCAILLHRLALPRAGTPARRHLPRAQRLCTWLLLHAGCRGNNVERSLCDVLHDRLCADLHQRGRRITWSPHTAPLLGCMPLRVPAAHQTRVLSGMDFILSIETGLPKLFITLSSHCCAFPGTRKKLSTCMLESISIR
jgi:hypothetical protein